jgi:hypothetical protein
MLFVVVVLKPVPVNVTASPGLADAGLKEVMLTCEKPVTAHNIRNKKLHNLQ